MGIPRVHRGRDLRRVAITAVPRLHIPAEVLRRVDHHVDRVAILRTWRRGRLPGLRRLGGDLERCPRSMGDVF